MGLNQEKVFEEKIWDVCVVGAGAAGLMTAIQAARLGLSVLLLDGQKKIGAKILMSGGNRCNVTHVKVSENDYQNEDKRFVRNVLRAFTERQALDFFKSLGVNFVLEETGKYFPSTHSGKTILEKLISQVESLNVSLRTFSKVEKVDKKNERFVIAGSHFEYFASTVVLCTGGLSYPSTGSDGSGYKLSSNFSHSLIETLPALTPLKARDELWNALAGVSCRVELSMRINNKVIALFEDDFLFTHFGYSGPAALNISRHWEKTNKAKVLHAQVTANFLPGETQESLTKLFADPANSSRKLKALLAEKLPQRLSEVLLIKTGIAADKTMSNFSRQERLHLQKNLLECPLPVSSVWGYAKAEATAGGVPLAETDYKTMQSKLCPGLFFAGEILDVDGRIGGFNFQWAWSSGTVAARGVKSYLNK